MTLPIPAGWRFPDAYCHACGETVDQEHAIAVWADGKPIGWAHERDCTKDDA